MPAAAEAAHEDPVPNQQVPHPMTREERLEAYGILMGVGLRGAELGAKLIQDGELDPDTRAILLGLEGVSRTVSDLKSTVQAELESSRKTMADELRSGRWWTLWTTTLAMLLVGGLFGLASQVSLPGGGSVSVSPSAIFEAVTGPEAP